MINIRKYLHPATLFAITFITALVFPLYQFIHSGDFLTHDRAVHAFRTSEYYSALVAGHIPPRLAPYFLGGSGYPLFLMNYQLPYLVGSAFLAIGLSAEITVRILTVFSYILYAAGGFLFFKTIASRKIAALATLNLVYTPYLFANIFIRGALPEFMASAILMWILYAISSHKQKNFPTLVVGCLLGLQLLTQTTVALIGLPLVIMVTSLSGGKRWLSWCASAMFAYAIGGLLASFILIPAVFERHYFQFDTQTHTFINNHFIPLTQLIKLPFFHTTDSALELSFTQTFLMIASLVLLPFGRKLASFWAFGLLALSWCFLYLITPQAGFLWNNVSIIQAVVFPWRLLTPISITVSILLIYLIKLHRRLFVPAVVLTLMSMFLTRHFIKPVEFSAQFVQISDQYVTGTTDGVFTPIGARTDKTLITLPSVRILSGRAQVLQNEQSVGRWIARVIVDEAATVQAKVLYFPGWRFFVNGHEQLIPYPIVTHYPNSYPGLPEIGLSTGVYTLEFRYVETTLRKVGNILSLSTFLMLSICLLKKSKILKFMPICRGRRNRET
ncbi:MAG: hypothetical protein Q7S45_04455 [Candidatus Curtissbacteria bacterium]|nr:hypothetical protein [Candidatus Curtissbacteria bacterium]